MAAPQITVRLTVSEDLDALHERESRPGSYAARRHFERQQAGSYFYAVAERNGTILGFCALDCDSANSLRPELLSLWVYPEYRRQGAAAALTTYLEGCARELGFVEVFLRVDPNNAAAIPMYIGLDYTPTGDHVVTSREWVDEDGTPHSADYTEAIYRKSLSISR